MKTFFNIETLWQSLRTALLGLLVFGVLAVVSAYTDPMQSPPQGGTLPVNVGPAAQKKEGSLSLGAGTAVPAGAGSLVTGGNVYIQTPASASGAIFFGERGRAGTDFPGRGLLGIGWDIGVSKIGSFAGDWSVMDGTNPALFKNVFANDYWIATANKWASQLGGSGVTPNLQQVTDAGNATTQNITASDIISGGANSWLWHTPDDGRTASYLAPGTNGGNWNWGANFEFKNNGDLNANDVWLRKVNRWASQTSGQELATHFVNGRVDLPCSAENSPTITVNVGRTVRFASVALAYVPVDANSAQNLQVWQPTWSGTAFTFVYHWNTWFQSNNDRCSTAAAIWFAIVD
ncbi:MAG: hypothetical protein Q7R73_00155 [bacterium]|nr:hypothetical protein [bacterium]